MATRHSWTNLKPLPAQRSRLALEREFVEQEYAYLGRGLIPRSMEDKWFIFVEEDTLYIHRSWTGYCIYQLSLIKQDGGYSIGAAFVNRDASQYSSVDARYDEQLVMFLIERLLLGRNAPLPVAPNLPADIATDLHLHHVIGAGQRAEDGPKELSISSMLRWLGRWLVWLIKG